MRSAWETGPDDHSQRVGVYDACPYCGHSECQDSDAHDRSQTAVVHRILGIVEDEDTGHLPRNSLRFLLRRVVYGESLAEIGQVLGMSKQHVQQTLIKLCRRWPEIAPLMEDTRSAHRGTYLRGTGDET